MTAREFAILALGTAAVLLTGCVIDGDEGCECAWEGGQSFSLNAAHQDADVVYLSLTDQGSPCCADGWTVQRTVAADFAGYTSGTLFAETVAAAAGSVLVIEPDGLLFPSGLDIALEPTSDMTSSQSVSVSAERAELYEIIEGSTGTPLGMLDVPVGR